MNYKCECPQCDCGCFISKVVSDICMSCKAGVHDGEVIE